MGPQKIFWYSQQSKDKIKVCISANFDSETITVHLLVSLNTTDN